MEYSPYKIYWVMIDYKSFVKGFNQKKLKYEMSFVKDGTKKIAFKRFRNRDEAVKFVKKSSKFLNINDAIIINDKQFALDGFRSKGTSKQRNEFK